MKKMIVSVLCLLVMCIGISFAGNMESVVVSAVSTNTVTGDDYVWGANTLIISTSTRKTLIKELDISNDSSDFIAQTVTLWDGWTADTSSAAVTKIWEVTIGSGTDVRPYSKTFRDGDRGFLKADRGLAATKSSTAGNVRISIQYK